MIREILCSEGVPRTAHAHRSNVTDTFSEESEQLLDRTIASVQAASDWAGGTLVHLVTTLNLLFSLVVLCASWISETV